jgi:hypothetical protein
MKMTKFHFNELSGLIKITMAETPNPGHSRQRYAWDMLWASGYDTSVLYEYLNDSHIETALFKIVGEY